MTLTVLRRALCRIVIASLTLFASPCAQAQSTVGVDVFLHFVVPIDGPLEKLTVSVLRASNEAAPLYVAEDRQQAKFSATTEHDLLRLAQAMAVEGIPLSGFHVMWPDTPLFLSLSTAMNGAPTLVPSTSPAPELVAARKETWIAAFPALYERLLLGTSSTPVK